MIEEGVGLECSDQLGEPLRTLVYLGDERVDIRLGCQQSEDRGCLFGVYRREIVDNPRASPLLFELTVGFGRLECLKVW